MSNVELRPARVFEQFAEINKIPRPSKHEENMIAYLKKFAAAACSCCCFVARVFWMFCPFF